MQKPIFITKATALPADWANAVSDLVYDAFNLCRTLQDVRTRLGLEGLAYQDHRNVNIQGGGINGVVIGATSARAGTFTQITLQELTPRQPNSATSKYYVDGLVAESIGALSWKDMAQQRSNAVSITGGSGVFDRLKSRALTVAPDDVVTFGALTNVTGPLIPALVTALTPLLAVPPQTLSVAGNQLSISGGNTVTLPATPVNVAKHTHTFVTGTFGVPPGYTSLRQEVTNLGVTGPWVGKTVLSIEYKVNYTTPQGFDAGVIIPHLRYDPNALGPGAGGWYEGAYAQGSGVAGTVEAVITYIP
jgi:hypothetical protein